MWHVAREDEQKKQQFYICRNPSLEGLKQPQGCTLAEGAKPLPVASLPDFSVLYSPQRGPFKGYYVQTSKHNFCWRIKQT